MNNARPRQLCKFRVLVEQGIHQGTAAMACRRVHDQAGRLVQHQEVGVFVIQVEVDCLALPAHLLVLGRHQRQARTHSYLVAWLDRRAVDQQVTTANPGLQTGARELREQFSGHLVQPFTVLFCGD